MEISEVRVKLVEKSRERLQAFCSITLDGDFVIRDLKIIGGSNGPFVAMPSRKLADRCPRCGSKNHLRARFCNECGAKLRDNRAPRDAQGRAKLHADVAHPINSECRERIQKALIEAYRAELERSQLPDYKPQAYDDDYEDDDEFDAPPPPPVAPEPEIKSASKVADSFSDYNKLVADLKKDAEGRRRKHNDQQRTTGFAVDSSEGEDFETAPPSSPRRERPAKAPAASADGPPKADRDRPVSRQARPADDRSERSGDSRGASSPEPPKPDPSQKEEREGDDFGAGLF